MKYKLISYIIINYFKEFSFERSDIKFIEKQHGANNIK